MRHKALVLLTLSLAAIGSLILAKTAGATDKEFLDAVRRADTPALRTLLKAGADPNLRDDMGATALMYAAAFSTPDCVRALLGGGADVNAASNSGATAVMWATSDVAKVRLLLDAGAAVNARAKDGTTALVTAARRGNVEAMRLLLARGADPKASANNGAELIRVAYGVRPETRPILMEAGIELKDWTQLQSALANFSTLLDPDAVRALLSLDANPNPAGGKYPALGQAAFAGQLGTVRLLIEGGAGPDAKARQDVTPLMMAAAAPLPNTALVRLLIEKGADLHARDMSGRTVLDWALMQGGTEVARLLRSSGATALVAPASPPPRVKTPRPVRTSIAEAVTRLQPISRTFYEHAKCASCHNQFLPAIANDVGR